ncbi:hypothetical protein PVAP13_9KG391211 [Panicum virgatum]|uniref:Uncharacterized protein n=1 Tax=Panicum virgatum TaxID=38727 RepID=A0A8T0N9D2_PANVG|nr:hypothetical protein PVAP13_9KG391211 [Panicum virgatum]
MQHLVFLRYPFLPEKSEASPEQEGRQPPPDRLRVRELRRESPGAMSTVAGDRRGRQRNHRTDY